MSPKPDMDVPIENEFFILHIWVSEGRAHF